MKREIIPLQFFLGRWALFGFLHSILLLNPATVSRLLHRGSLMKPTSATSFFPVPQTERHLKGTWKITIPDIQSADGRFGVGIPQSLPFRYPNRPFPYHPRLLPASAAQPLCPRLSVSQSFVLRRPRGVHPRPSRPQPRLDLLHGVRPPPATPHSPILHLSPRRHRCSAAYSSGSHGALPGSPGGGVLS